MTIPDSESMVEVGVSDFPCTPEDERRIVTELNSEAEANLKEGNLYFVISNRWYKIWQSFVGLLKEEFSSGEHSEVTRPGPIDNHDIIESESDVSDPQIRKMLEEGVDYVLVPEKVWEKLVEWYKGGPPIQRKMISQGFNYKSYSVEVYPLVLNLTDDRDKSCTIITLSRKASISQLYETVCALKEVSKEKARIYDYFDRVKGDFLNPSSEQNLEEASLLIDLGILLEVNGSVSSPIDTSSAGKELALVPSEPTRSDTTDIMLGGWTPSNYHSNGSKYGFYGRNNWEDDECDSLSAFGKGKSRGLVGLQNLGNTCFMNSTLQCLAHTPPIVEYFLQDYSDDINAENPLGMQGQLAIAFGDLLRKLWSSGQGTVAPRSFKAKLSRFAPQFSGYNQHDSQEMLAFLLDGLHEDLNKVKRKPYIEAKDSDSRPDDEVAEELWKYHKARNDSVIVDVCQGQYKSTLVCPDCGKISITFDPFMYLTLPLPSSRTRSMTVAVFYGDGSRLWTPYTVTVPKDGCIRDLSTALGTACCLNDDECLLLAEIYQHKVYKYFKEPLDSLSGIKNNDHIVAYRFNKMHIGSGKAILEILHAEQRKYILGRQLFGTPLVTYIDEEPHSLTDIDTIISRLLSPLHRVHENGHVPDVADETTGSLSPRDTETEGDAAVVDRKLSTEDDAVVVDRNLSFSLLKPDSFCTNFKPIEPDSVVNPGCSSVTKFAVEWNETEHEKYDSSYLTHLLPVVYRIDFSLKQPWQEEISMFWCLEAFLGEEPLGQDDMWYCPNCKEHRQANKKLDLWKLPDVLVIHLKRFTYCRYSKDKIDTFVDYPVHDLDLSKYVKSKDGQTYLYELYAVSNHYGGMGGGHYTACAKLMDENKWYCFDDSFVATANESDIKSSAAYVLFYRRVRSESETSEMEVD
uniref:Ubiquitin carboxyl-terminal hydrolase n=1 Tax=Noccaea caerulescens TaxID=107243 RepID=A0A1J3FN28_NOCCA